MCREEFELKLKEAGFENIDTFINETNFEKRKVENYLQKDNFPNYFNLFFECLIKIKGVDFDELRKREDKNLQLELEALKEENRVLIDELRSLKSMIKE
ncbi:hypothetical protein [Campylobacter helveticus]|uniref:hypothetical protein n=1 Tax=Campylobacter helveticus TaxID=28898 RepID=UPI0022EB1919|nr:hypothetical protein [Campylobacter helveticus]